MRGAAAGVGRPAAARRLTLDVAGARASRGAGTTGLAEVRIRVPVAADDGVVHVRTQAIPLRRRGGRRLLRRKDRRRRGNAEQNNQNERKRGPCESLHRVPLFVSSVGWRPGRPRTSNAGRSYARPRSGSILRRDGRRGVASRARPRRACVNSPSRIRLGRRWLSNSAAQRDGLWTAPFRTVVSELLPQSSGVLRSQGVGPARARHTEGAA
jgi:hypothetical protein